MLVVLLTKTFVQIVYFVIFSLFSVRIYFYIRRNLLTLYHDFFLTLFFSGDRANDLSTIKTQEILRFPQDDALLFNHVWGKTVPDGSSNLFGVRRHQNPALCPVKAIETYMAISAELGLDLHGFLFQPSTTQGTIANKQVSSSAMQTRL